jgi:RNA polymerase sigma factor (sigma-70 family)
VLFEEFYKQTFKNTFRFFYYRGVIFNDVDDLTSDCYVRFYEKYQEKLIDETESRKILGGIAANILKEWQRKTYSIKIDELSDDVTDTDLFDFYAKNDFEKDFGEKQLKLHEAIKSLNPTVRQVLDLRFLQNKSRKQTAILLQIGEDQVHTYQKRGVKYLKDRLNGEIEQKSKSKEQRREEVVDYSEENTPSSFHDATPLTEGNSSS